MPEDDIELLTDRVIGAIIKVHGELGPGFREKAYSNSMAIEMRKQAIPFEREKEIRVYYEGEEVDQHYLDDFVDGRLVLELKAVKELTGDDYAQIRAYMKAAECNDGLLVNFAKAKADFRRVRLEITKKPEKRG